MKIAFKILCACLFVATASFAQDDFETYSSENGNTSYYAPAEDTEGANYYSADDPNAPEATSDVGTLNASSSEWAGFDYEAVGLTQWEFQQAKESGMSRDKLTQLTELGVRPSEYLQEPWKRLGVTEESWLGERANGLEDSDIDRTYRNHAGEQNYAYISLAIPSFYQWKHEETVKAIWMDALWVVGVAGLTYFAINSDNYDNTWVYWLIPVLGAHVWSFADAFFGTQWSNNPDANRFSLGIGPNLDRGVAGILQLRF